MTSERAASLVDDGVDSADAPLNRRQASPPEMGRGCTADHAPAIQDLQRHVRANTLS